MNIKRVILTVFMVVFLVMTVSAAEGHAIIIGFDEISDYPVIELGNSGKVRIPDYSFHSFFDDLFGARIGYEIENVVPYCMTVLKIEQNSVYDESRFKVYIDSDDEINFGNSAAVVELFDRDLTNDKSQYRELDGKYALFFVNGAGEKTLEIRVFDTVDKVVYRDYFVIPAVFSGLEPPEGFLLSSELKPEFGLVSGTDIYMQFKGYLMFQTAGYIFKYSTVDNGNPTLRDYGFEHDGYFEESIDSLDENRTMWNSAYSSALLMKNADIYLFCTIGIVSTLIFNRTMKTSSGSIISLSSRQQ